MKRKKLSEMKQDNIFNLYSYTDVTANVKILNTHQLENYVWIALPKELSFSITLSKVEEIVPNNGSIDFIDKVAREGRHPWLCVRAKFLNKSDGYHLYKLTFKNHATADILPLYFAYRIQNDNPEKSYVYMKNKEKGGNGK